ncbi:MAG: hypothetical protein J6S51_05655 [Kiritimatiellae bacterium]|nr:hypothetical protein [Kiritimatiellia bacterium]
MTMFSFVLAAALTINPKEKSVTIGVVSCDPGVDQEIEFLIVGPDSEHAYESLFTTEAPILDIAKAFEKVGLPKGKPVEFCSYFPTGHRLEMKPSISDFITDSQPQEESLKSIVYTGGTRHHDDTPVASTNMPLALFALYNLPQSLIQLDDTLPQSPTYGRFKAKKKIKKGERLEITFKLVPNSCDKYIDAKFDDLKSAKNVLASLKAEAQNAPISVKPIFSENLTVEEATAIAQALRAIQSPRVKINGLEDRQLFYSSFLPLEAWKDPKLRLVQPVEIFLGQTPENDKLRIVNVDWSDPNSNEPKYEEKFYKGGQFDKIGKQDTCLVYAKKDTPLKRIYELKRRYPKTMVNWYVYP